MTLRTRYLILIGVVWGVVNVYLHKDYIIGENWSSSEHKSPPVSVKVVLLAYHRSGSSFMGELFSSCNLCSYFFEPLFYEDHIRHVPTVEAYRDNIRGVFNCDKKILDELRSNPYVWIIRKFGETTGIFNGSNYDIVNLCKQDEMQVIKTIRLRINDAAPLFQEISDFKILHLVRDPRAVFHSIHSKGEVWSVEDRSPEQHCKDVYRDLVGAREFPRDRYLLLRYEDVVSNALNATRAVYAFLGRTIPPAVESYIAHHMHAEANPNNVNEAKEYFSTFRNSSFRGDQWKTKMSRAEITRVERSCRNVMDIVGYKPFADMHR